MSHAMYIITHSNTNFGDIQGSLLYFAKLRPKGCAGIAYLETMNTNTDNDDNMIMSHLPITKNPTHSGIVCECVIRVHNPEHSSKFIYSGGG